MTDFVPLVIMWWGMMAAMMFPVTLPWFRTLKRLGGGPAALGRFGTGYFGVWLIFGLVAAGLQTTLAGFGLFSAGRAAPWIGAGVLACAGLYQLSPLKASCLKHCRSPMSFFLSRWNDGPARTLRLGAEHGLFCVGCCWALMLIGFGVGVMNLWWMLLLTGIVMVENLTDFGRGFGRAAGLGLILLALAGCGEDPLNCTLDFRYGLTIEVVDAATFAPIEEATGTITDGDFEEELMSLGSGDLVGAGERPGTYDIVVEAPGYRPWTREEVTLGFDGCHVIGQSFAAALEPSD